VTALRDAINSDDDARIRTSMEALQQTLYTLGQNAYSADGDDQNGAGSRKKDEGVVEGEYTVD
jgi:molecular chaperone DnaK